MSRQAHIDRVWHVIDKVGICMMTTQFAGGMRARTMEARTDKDAGVIWFLTDHRGLKDDEIDATPAVCLTFVYEKEKVHLSPAKPSWLTIRTGPGRCGMKIRSSGGAGPTIRICAWSASSRKKPRCGTDRRVQPLPLSIRQGASDRQQA